MIRCSPGSTRLVPGTGPLADRVEAFQNRFIIPRDRLDAVMRAAIDECRRRTVQHIALPAGRELHARVRHRPELVGLQLVPGRLSQPHPGQHRPAGAAEPRGRSRLPRRLSGPPRLQRAARAEAGARPRLGRIYGLSALLAAVLHRRRLGQLRHRARLSRRRAARLRDAHALPARRPARPTAPPTISRCRRRCRRSPAPASPSPATISRGGSAARRRSSSPSATSSSRARRAEQSIAFTDQYRAYVINYGLGRDMVARHVEAAGRRSGGALGGDGAASCPSRPCRRDLARRPR